MESFLGLNRKLPSCYWGSISSSVIDDEMMIYISIISFLLLLLLVCWAAVLVFYFYFFGLGCVGRENVTFQIVQAKAGSIFATFDEVFQSAEKNFKSMPAKAAAFS